MVDWVFKSLLVGLIISALVLMFFSIKNLIELRRLNSLMERKNTNNDSNCGKK